jgi:hypothetical protein
MKAKCMMPLGRESGIVSSSLHDAFSMIDGSHAYSIPIFRLWRRDLGTRQFRVLLVLGPPSPLFVTSLFLTNMMIVCSRYKSLVHVLFGRRRRTICGMPHTYNTDRRNKATTRPARYSTLHRSYLS